VTVHLEPWGEGDLPLLRRTLGDPEMTKYLGGPESEEKLADRQQRFERLTETGDGRMFKIVDDETGAPAGSVGYWKREWGGEEIYETGWLVLPEFQGRGVATEATRQVISTARADGGPGRMHAFPGVENAASNAICRRLGFNLAGEIEFEYPPGSTMRCNDWWLDIL